MYTGLTLFLCEISHSLPSGVILDVFTLPNLPLMRH
ncbi:hypothetical protein EVA_20659 [gut metagenome]|uniref:Uncharacterized protein n=1 Tax=gut metagenome TaxID=749906 RepID=J9FV49_9ZZZZ